MKIGMLLDNTFFNDTRVKNEVQALEKAGYEVFVLCLSFDKNSKIQNFGNSVIHRVKVSHFFKDKIKFFSNSVFDLYSVFWTYHTLKFVKKYKLDILHAHDLYMGRPAIIVSKFYKLKTVIDLHENYPSAVMSYSWAQSFLGKLFVSKKRWLIRESKILVKFNRIIVLSESFKDELLERNSKLNSKQFILFPNYPDINELLSYKIDSKILEKKNDFIVFYFGAIAVRRGIFTLLEALKLIVNTYKNVKILIIGPLDKADRIIFYEQINDPKIKNNIIYYEWKDISLFPSYLYISDVCVSPLIKNEQHESGIANKVFQYMLFNKPVIVSDCKPQMEVVLKEESGLVFKSENAQDLANQIITLYNDNELTKKLGVNGKAAVIEKYNLEKSSENLIKSYGLLNGS